MKKGSKPEQSFTIGGFRPTGRFRIRIRWGFIPVVEQLYHYRDGVHKWRRLQWLEKVEFEGWQ